MNSTSEFIHQAEPSDTPTGPSKVLWLTVLQEVGAGSGISSDWWSDLFERNSSYKLNFEQLRVLGISGVRF